MSFRCLQFLLLLALGATQLPACAQAPDKVPPAALPPGTARLPWLDSLLAASAVLRQHQVGLCLVDAATGETLFGYNEARYFTPASTMKLFSLYAGLKLLPDSLPSLRYFSRGDTLFFQGTGDPTLLHGDVPSRRAYVFLQGRPERLLAYCDIATVPAYGPSWSWDDYPYYFQPERTAFPLYGNTVRFYGAVPAPAPRPRAGAGATAGPRPQRVRVVPRSFAPLTEPAPAGPLSPDQDPDAHVRRELLENRFYVVSSDKKWVDEIPFRTSRTMLLRQLGDTLRRAIVGVGWRPRPADAVRTLRGLPVDSLYRRMLRVSDNFLAEQLLLMGSTTLGRDSLSTERAIRATLKTHLSTLPDRPVWVDGSGLSRQNLVTPRALTALLCRLHQELPEARLLGLLAAGGGQGTLRRRYFDPAVAATKTTPAVPKQPWFWGKTGSLTHTVNLAGYVRTRSGRLLAVSFLNNGFPGDDQPVRNEVERLLRQVRERL